MTRRDGSPHLNALTATGKRHLQACQAASLAHLEPITRPVTLELQGRIRKIVDVLFHFSSHCYSRGLRDDDNVPRDQLIRDGSAHAPRFRVFDPERYELSKDLVGMIDHLISQNGTVSKSRHDNFHRTDRVVVERDGSLKPVAYFIFMRACVVQDPGRPKSMRVTVESAYPERDDIPNPSGRGSRTFARMLGDTWQAQRRPP